LVSQDLHTGTVFSELCQGRIDGVSFSLGRLGPWDIAAPAAIIRALGGVLCNERGERFCFGRDDRGVFHASAPPLSSSLTALYSRAFPEEQNSELARPLLCDQLTDVTLREGSQISGHLRGLSVAKKIALLQKIVAAGSTTLEVSAFAPGPWFSDAEELADEIASLPLREQEDLQLKFLYFNIRGAEKLTEYPYLSQQGVVHTAVTERYRKKNYRQLSEKDAFDKHHHFLRWFRERGVDEYRIMFSTAWGEKEEHISADAALSYIERYCEGSQEGTPKLAEVVLADTEGVADAASLSELLFQVRRALPGVRIGLHLHPPAGGARPLIDAALDAGVDRWEAAWCGVGGSPLAQGAGGNLDICELLDAYDERGWETGFCRTGVAQLKELLKEHCKGLG
ncbi:hypothetical protein MRY87_12100, partial [bacterium]|nr:hypothetical protein [bacterium]